MNIRSIFALCVCLFSFSHPLFCEESPAIDDPELRAIYMKQLGKSYLIAPSRKELLPEDLIIPALKIKPEMTIVDVGAGTGIFTFPLAKALNNTGKVFATDVIPESISYIRRKAKELGYNNIESVVVKKDGADPFYKTRQFDIIFICDLLPYIKDLKSYFAGLQPSLVKDSGRLYIIEPKSISDFDKVDFGDFKSLLQGFKKHSNSYSVFARLSAGSREYIQNWKQGEEIPSAIRAGLVKDLNDMLLDRSLFYDLTSYYAGRYLINEDIRTWTEPFMRNIGFVEAKHIKLLFVGLDKTNVFDDADRSLTKQEQERLLMLNKTCVFATLHISSVTHLLEQVSPYVIFRDEESIVSKAESAGFECVKKHDFLPKYYFLEFKRKE